METIREQLSQIELKIALINQQSNRFRAKIKILKNTLIELKLERKRLKMFIPRLRKGMHTQETFDKMYPVS